MAVVKRKAKYKAGQWILIPFRPEPLKALILEDMGCLGPGGEHAYFIHVPERDYGDEEFTQVIGEERVVGPG